MKNKKSFRMSCLRLALLVVLGGFVWGAFTGIGKAKLETALDSAISFSKARIVTYDSDTSNDRIKSLVRLLDKTENLRRDMVEYSDFEQSDLDTFAGDQRLSGVLVLDRDLNTVMRSTQVDVPASAWESTLAKSYIQELLDHPEATYTEQTDIAGIWYDLAVVPRSDAPGLLLAYVQKDRSDAISDGTSLDSLFVDYPLQMDGVIVVCSEDEVVSSNQQKFLGIASNTFREMYGGNFQPDSDGIFKVSSDGHTWYGRQKSVGSYTLFVMFPSSQVFLGRLMAVIIYTVLAALAFVTMMFTRSNMEKQTLQEAQKRLRIITALGTAYSSIVLISLETGLTEIIKAPRERDIVPDRDLARREDRLALIGRVIAPEYRDAFAAFVDMGTIKERLGEKKSITITVRNTYGIWLEAVIVPQKFDKNGGIAAVLLACRDVTAEKEKEIEQEQNLRSALASAEHANKAKTNFLNSVSHDIRTPMNAIMGYTALATTHIDNQAQVGDYLKKISTSSQHLLSLINDVLDMSRIESGVVKIDEGPVHLPDIMHDLRSIILGNLVAKQHDLHIYTQNIAHEDIIADKLRLNQVLLNIVGNAIKFTPVGGMIDICVEESPSEKSGYATYTFRVKDTGIGISKEFQKDIFDPFAREQTVTKSGIQGTGLGMAICKNIVDMMGGTITVNSELGKGSEFVVTIDFKISGQTVSYQPIPELQGARALVVDDDLNTCMSVCKMLREIDMAADWTTTGKEAVFRAQEAFDMQRPFRVYIVDWQMPDMNGLETIRRIRKVIGPDTPIIILTAYDWTDIEQEAKEVGVTAFVSKPLFMSELRAVLTQKKQPAEVCEEDTAKCSRYQGLKVLLVEDNALNSEIAAMILEEAGLNVDTVPDGIDAVERMVSAAPDRYDVILMDIQMPQVDGYTATREIRTLSDNRKANIPIIAMTANAFEEDKEKALKAGMNGYISKPIDIQAILTVFDKAFGKNP